MLEGLDPNIVAIGIFLAGFFISRMEKGGAQHTKSVQVDTDLNARVRAVEEKLREQGSITTTVTRLETLLTAQTAALQNTQRDIHTLRVWIMQAAPPRRERSPFDFPGAREWVEAEPHT